MTSIYHKAITRLYGHRHQYQYQPGKKHTENMPSSIHFTLTSFSVFVKLLSVISICREIILVSQISVSFTVFVCYYSWWLCLLWCHSHFCFTCLGVCVCASHSLLAEGLKAICMHGIRCESMIVNSLYVLFVHHFPVQKSLCTNHMLILYAAMFFSAFEC